MLRLLQILCVRVCVRVCACARVRVCVRLRAHACAHLHSQIALCVTSTCIIASAGTYVDACTMHCTQENLSVDNILEKSAHTLPLLC